MSLGKKAKGEKQKVHIIIIINIDNEHIIFQ